MKRTLAAADLVLVAPGIAFFLALFLRNFLPDNDGTNGAQSIVMWYAHRQWALWILLIALPAASIVLGGTFLQRAWTDDESLRADTRQVLLAVRAHLTLIVAALATISATVVLFLVALHMATH